MSTFELIDSNGDHVTGFLRLRYGSGPADPLPFILTLKPSYVAHALGKTLPISLQDIQEFAGQNGDFLKTVAQNAKDRGFSTEVLE